MVLFHVSKTSIKQFIFCILWSQWSVTGGGNITRNYHRAVLHELKVLQVETVLQKSI
jgi:hypothetical protein